MYCDCIIDKSTISAHVVNPLLIQPQNHPEVSIILDMYKTKQIIGKVHVVILNFYCSQNYRNSILRWKIKRNCINTTMCQLMWFSSLLQPTMTQQMSKAEADWINPALRHFFSNLKVKVVYKENKLSISLETKVKNKFFLFSSTWTFLTNTIKPKNSDTRYKYSIDVIITLNFDG